MRPKINPPISALAHLCLILELASEAQSYHHWRNSARAHIQIVNITVISSHTTLHFPQILSSSLRIAVSSAFLLSYFIFLLPQLQLFFRQVFRLCDNRDIVSLIFDITFEICVFAKTTH